MIIRTIVRGQRPPTGCPFEPGGFSREYLAAFALAQGKIYGLGVETQGFTVFTTLPSFFGISFRLKGTGLLVLKGRIMLDHIFFNILLHCWWISPWHGFVSNWGISQNGISWKVTLHHWMLGDFWALYPKKKHDFISSLWQLSWENDENPLKPLDNLGFQVDGTQLTADSEEFLGAAAVHHWAPGTDLGGARKKISALNR